MRLALRFTLFAFLVSSLLVSAAGIPGNRRYEHGALANIQARATDAEATTAVATTKEAATATEASTTGGTRTSATSEASATGNGTSTTQAHTQTATTGLALATPTGFQNGTNETENALPLQPTVTPALGVGGFILLATGAILALIGIRNLWVQVFLSTAFLTSLGVTVLIVYVMNPPVSVAVEGAYLVAVFFTGVTFGALSIVFKELTEGLGCLLGGFCLSMWLLCLKPGGLLTDANSKSGFIGAIAVGIYALSFSHYTRPYALIGSTAASGGTAVALGIDCFSRAGLKEFWLYIWALNEDIFPLNTNTYPVTRNIRVELAATVIVAILGVISQLRLWNVVRERRRKEEELRAEEQRKKDEAEAEMGRRLEENNEKERLAWEARYGNGSGPDIPELGTNSKTCLADEKADFKKDMDSLATSSSGESSASSERSYRCEDCLEREENGESLYARSVVSDSSDDSQDEQEEGEAEVVEKKIPKKSSKKKRKSPPLKVFDGAAAARMKNDNNSEVTAIVGSETGSIRSKRFSGQSMIDRMSMTSSTRQMSESQEALVSCGDAASYMQDDDESDIHSDGAETHKKAGSVHGDSDTEDVSKPKKALESTSEDTVTKNADAPSVYSREVEDVKDVKAVKSEDASAKVDGGRSSSTTVKGPATEKDDKTKKTEKSKQLEAVTDASPSQDKAEEAEGSEQPRAAVDKTQLEDQAKKASKSSVKGNKPEEPVKETTKSSKIISMIKKYEPSVEDTAEETVKKARSSKSSKSKKPASKTSGSDLREAAEADVPVRKPSPTVKDAETSKSEEPSPTPDAVVNPSTSDGSTIRSSSSAQQSQESSDLEDTPPKVKESHKRKPSSRSKTKAKPKKEEPAKLDARHVKQLPQRDSIVVQSYRTNEWAKHLADAEVLEPEPIEPVEEEVVEYTIEDEQPAAPVNVEELLQTPLNAQPPPAVERHASISKSTHTNENHRKSEDSQSRRNSQSTKRGSRSKRTSGLSSMSPVDSPQPLSLETHIAPVQVSMSGAFNPSSPLPPIADAVEQPREEAEPPKAQWVGPPPLIAVREDMMQNKLSSFSPSTEPWSRNSPGLPISTRSSPVQSIFPTLEDPDNIPLSRRRTMLHQRTMRSSPTNANPPSAVRWSQGSAAPMAGPAPAVTAPRRASVRENGYNHNASRASLSRHNSVGTLGSPLGQGQWSTSSINLDQAIAQGMQRGDMSNLHRDVMRRMQAKANQQVNGTISREIGEKLGIDVALRPKSVPGLFPLSVAPFPLPANQPPSLCLTPTPTSTSSSSSSISSSTTASSSSFPRSTPPIPPSLPSLASAPSLPDDASLTPSHSPLLLSSPAPEKPASCAPPPPRGPHRNPRGSSQSHSASFASAHHIRPKSSSRSLPRHRTSWVPPTILRPPAVRLANPVNYVPRIAPVVVPHPHQDADDRLPLEAPLLSLPERRRSRVNPSPNSLVVERSQGESDSGRSSIALPRGQRRSGAFGDFWPLPEMSDPIANDGSSDAANLRAPDRAHLAMDNTTASDARGPLDDRPRHVQSQTSLRSQAHIASIPSQTGQPSGGEAETNEELAWGPAHPCYPHINPHVPLGSQEYLTTRIIRIRRDWMIKGDLAPTFSNLYPEILDPLLPEQEFRRVVATINDELVKTFNPFSLRNWIDSALGLLTGWLWEDIGASGVKSRLRQLEDWLERWNREVGEKDGVHIWSLRRTAYMSLDIQIPDPKVGIVPSEGGPSLPGTRPGSAIEN